MVWVVENNCRMKEKIYITNTLTHSFLFFLLLLLCNVFGIKSLAKDNKKPNILFVLTDDQAPWAFSASGDPNAITPNMDKLAKNGAVFRNAFTTTPVCSPSRVSIMTGRYASEYGIYDFIVSPTHSSLTYDPTYNAGLDPESVTFAEVLQKAGYKTGLVGKWHLGDWTTEGDKKYHPTNHGFDYFMGLIGGGVSTGDPELEVEGELRKIEGLTTDILADYAIKFIKDNSADNFLLCLNTRAPHARWLPVSESDWAPFENMDPILPNPGYPDLDIEKTKRLTREYLASTRGMDRNLGRVIDVLEELGLLKNTIIIFFSDNGYNMGHNGIEHKGNGKWITKTKPDHTENIKKGYRPNLYDNSLKVPAFVYWEGVVKPGTVIDNTVSVLDLYPTIVEIAGAELPDPKQHIIRGKSFLPLIKGTKMDNWNNDFYSEYSMINYATAFLRSYRTPKWKLVRDFMDPSRDELYHIALDPEENINLINYSSDEIKGVVDSLHQKILEQMEKINDPLLNEIHVDREYYKKSR